MEVQVLDQIGLSVSEAQLEATGVLAASAARIQNVLAWMDLEMTGLDPAKHVIVEIATLLTDNNLNVIAEGPELVINSSDLELSKMDKVVLDMHTKSGLLKQIKASPVTLEEAGKQTLDFLKEHIPKERSVPLCGNSIGMDRRFLAVYFPEIEEFLNYRSVDVSSVKELARRWNPGLLPSAPSKNAGHRALDDIRESVAELQYYQSCFFKLKNEPTEPSSAEPTGSTA